ncbi:MAG: hypothetical protein HYZ20_02335 [Burkholderiales bacterium]|nr:hypothetical protein [Burkholderiales bacterium]
MTHRHHALAAAALLAVCATQAQAIVGTGPGTGGGSEWSLSDIATETGPSFQHIAAGFEVTEATSIQLIRGWISSFVSGPSVDLLLFEGGDPDTAPPAYTTSFATTPGVG